MKTLLKPILLTVMLTTLLSACATKQELTKSEAEDKYQSVTILAQSINNSDQEMLALLSQHSFKLAVDASKESNELAIKDDYKAVEAAVRGEGYLNQAKKNAKNAENIFSNVLYARTQAIENGALTKSPKKLSELEVEFMKMTLDLEQGDIASAKLHRATMIQNYQSLELISLKKATVDEAKEYLAKARAADADTYAEKTFKMAEDQLALTLSMLNADKTSKEKAEWHAAQAIWLAEKSISITSTIKAFRANNFSSEDIVLWHQKQLSKAVKPLNMELPLNLSAKNLTETIARTISQVLQDSNELAQQRDEMLTAKQADFNALQSKYKGNNQQREKLELEKNKKLTFIQDLFNADEANVYREKDNILIRAQGFYFASGQSEIDSRNFSLLQKIGSAIAEYPNAKILVTGHTDANGYHVTNLKLSKLRADKVMKFLNEVGGVPLERITSEGFGEEKPVANNETIDGRNKNRRVEILIIN
ncbi:OmpA family protein [Marinomonas sp. RSW2]|uniref:OmpA family protein n=1 Tax=Marinomonas maritima TaxID=2940935 RepID=A0ABT5WFA8_9GAMM|nr:OmpA family protein [Marinomonas maritima]MDE8603044.1 OmpA family protein [Marinomonas maritima]